MAKYLKAPGAEPFEREWAGWAWGWTVVTLILLGMANVGVWYEWANGNSVFSMFRGRPNWSTPFTQDLLSLTGTFAVLAVIWTAFYSLTVVEGYYKEEEPDYPDLHPDVRDSDDRYSAMFFFTILFVFLSIPPLIGGLIALGFVWFNRWRIRAFVIAYREGVGRPLVITLIAYFLLWQGTQWAQAIANGVLTGRITDSPF